MSQTQNAIDARMSAITRKNKQIDRLNDEVKILSLELNALRRVRAAQIKHRIEEPHPLVVLMPPPTKIEFIN